jgi:diacylglycerol kinase family enzyme
VRGPAATEVEFDGDPRGCLPVEIAILPRALPLIGDRA